MAAAVRAAADGWGAPVGAVLEGGYALPALAESVSRRWSALAAEDAPCPS